jgi:hypothetical protein
MEAEHHALEKYARGRKSLVEFGVAEGASAVALQTTTDQEGTLYLVDPFHLSRVRPSSGYGPVRFVDRVFRNNPAPSWMIVEEVDSLMFVRRTESGSGNAAGPASHE